jgi:galacturonokinase
MIPGDWGNYARGAVNALQSRYSLSCGVVGLTTGSISEGGLSSSAAIGIAYLLALEHANKINASPWENVELDRLIENEYLGLRNGILDQAAILLSRASNLTVIDCQQGTHELVALPPSAPEHVWLIASSGIRQSLVTTGYNRRVEECTEAARVLLSATVRGDTRAILSEVSPEEYNRCGHLLSGASAKRARHFFSEMDRVNRGIEAWRRGDLTEFGSLMTQSGRSSIEQYECGSPPLVDLYKIIINTPGVLGARFSGAGFRGCSIALVEATQATQAARSIEERYKAAHPEVAADANVQLCHSADGAVVQ